MGNKASAQLLPPVEVMLKTFSNTEVQALEARFPTPSSTNHSTSGGGRKRSGSKESSPRSTLALVTKEQFIILLGEAGPSMRRLLLRLFAVLDANGTGALEYQEHVGAAYFFNHATAAERARVLFSMYEPTSSQSSSLSSPSATAASKAHLSKEHVATLCVETTLALTEMQATPPSVVASFSGGGNMSRGGGIPPPASAAAAAAAVVSLANINATTPPFKDLIGVMVDVAFLRWDADKDGKFSMTEFQAFVTQQNDNGIDELLGMLLSSPQVPKLLFDGADGGGDEEGEGGGRR